MKKLKFFGIFLSITFLFMSEFVFAQDVNIIPYLKQIEKGNKQEVESKLPQLKKQYPNNPSVMFLDGVLTENAQEAVAIFKSILNKYPHSKYADAALYRIYSYYYALGLYTSAKTFLTRLKREYPDSPYIEIAEKNIPGKDDTTATAGSNKKPEVKTQQVPTNADTLKDEQSYKYTIQAGAFGNSTNASALMKDFKDSGYFSEIKDKVVGGTTFHVVYVGKFASRSEAGSFLQIINKEFKLDGRVIPINQ